MITLADAIKNHWHSVERDLLSLGKCADDIGTSKLTLCELISVVVAAPPSSSLHHFAGGWSRTDELIANLTEHQAGLLNFNARYARPGVDSRFIKPASPMDSMSPYMGVQLDVFDSVDEFTAKRNERQQYWREKAEGKT